MRRWDRLLDSYIKEYRARGVGAASVGVDFTSNLCRRPRRAGVRRTSGGSPHGGN